MVVVVVPLDGLYLALDQAFRDKAILVVIQHLDQGQQILQVAVAVLGLLD